MQNSLETSSVTADICAALSLVPEGSLLWFLHYETVVCGGRTATGSSGNSAADKKPRLSASVRHSQGKQRKIKSCYKRWIYNMI